ncbi:MAG TPA: hypothetical protein VIJ08_03330 [Acidimicrobiales bacterium]
MRRLVALLVIALLGATLYGLSNYSSGISVNGSTVSSATLRNELAAISSNATLDCYVTALNAASFAPGAGGASVNASGAAAWANLRVEGLAIDQFAKNSLKFHPDAATLAKAQTTLESELSDAGASQSTPCNGTSTQALAEMPAEMRNFEIASQAASLDLVTKLNTTVPLTLASMKQYYSTHTANYDTICVSVAVVDPTEVTTFNEAQSAGMSVAALAKKFSADPSGAKGGAYGCFGPSSSSYAGVRTATLSTPLNTFPTTPEQTTYNNAQAALFVAPTKRTPTPFAQAENAVLSDLENANATAANLQKEVILRNSNVAVDPSVGSWGVASTGHQVFAPATPSSGVVGSSTITALGVGASTYK